MVKQVIAALFFRREVIRRHIKPGGYMKRVLFTVLLVVICACGSSQAHAAGFGLYGSVGGGSADWTVDDWSSTDLDFTKDTGHVNFGMMMDTAPARDKLFNYQLSIGYDRFRNTNGEAWGAADFEGFVISNCFGFGALVSPTIRFWMGPELRVTWLDGHPDQYKDYKIDLFGFGFGPVMGLNINFGDAQTLALKVGYQIMNYVGEGEGEFDHATNSASLYSNSYDYDIKEKMVYFTVGFMFRSTGDR
jgi:hypothetical protein